MSFRILVLGDFNGRSYGQSTGSHSTGGQSTGGQSTGLVTWKIDRDNFDRVLEQVGPAFAVNGRGVPMRTIHDFHPDELASRLETAEDTPPLTPSAMHGSVLDKIVAESEERDRPVSVDDAGDLRGFLKRITQAHTVTAVDDGAILRDRGDRLRAVLHDRQFQALEAGWRALRLLVRQASEDVSIALCSVRLPDLIRGLDGLAKKMAPEGPFSLVVADFLFGQGDIDAQALMRLGAFARGLGATLLAGAFAPEDEGGEGWDDLRHSDVASHVGLVVPRFLLRLPYGAAGRTVEAFPFEEMPDAPEHEDYLWGNGAFAAAALIAHAYDAADPDWRQHIQRRLCGLPLHVYQYDGETVTQPCAEVLMSEREADALLHAGFIPLASLKEQDSAIVVQFRSVAQQPTRLAVLEG